MVLGMVDQLDVEMGLDWISNNTFLVFDLETTGIDVTTDLPVSYAIMTMNQNSCIFEGYSLVNPGVEIPQEASRIHGISTERARESGLDLQVAIKLIVDALLRASNLGWFVVGMNVSFDLSIIDARARAIYGVGLNELGFNAPVLDILILDRHFDPYRSGRRTLEALCNFYGVAKGTLHNALEDCKVTYKVLGALVGKYRQITEIAPEALTGVQEEFYQSWVFKYNKWATANHKDEIQVKEWPIS